jgi:hypothetical protein
VEELRAPWLEDPESLVSVPLFILAQTSGKIYAQYKFQHRTWDEDADRPKPLSTWCAAPCKKHLRQELRGRECSLGEAQAKGLLAVLSMIAEYNQMTRLLERIHEYQGRLERKAQRCFNCSLWLDPSLAAQVECTFSPAKYALLNTTLCSRCHCFLCSCRITLPSHVFEERCDESWLQ